MNDVFYFTKTNISLDYIADIAKQSGFKHEFIGRPTIYLNIYYQPTNFWQWIGMREEEDFNGFGPHERAIVEVFQPASAFIICYHDDSLRQLSSFLFNILDCYGGLIVSDADNLEPIYTIDNINELYA
jgi:hypothetical protein